MLKKYEQMHDKREVAILLDYSSLHTHTHTRTQTHKQWLRYLTISLKRIQNLNYVINLSP